MNKITDLGNPWIGLTLKLWNRVISKNNLKEVIKILRWCAFDPDFMPKILDGLTAYFTFLSKG